MQTTVCAGIHIAAPFAAVACGESVPSLSAILAPPNFSCQTFA
jgi:hypothetical protein